jgi:pimeloyl-ACP methyl ester carboxylesterase
MMKGLARFFLVIVLLAALLPVGKASAEAAPVPTSCEDFGNQDPFNPFYIPGVQVISGIAPSGKYCITIPMVPPDQLKGVVIFAHGYVFAYPQDKEVDIPFDQLLLRDPQTQTVGSLPAIVNSMGFIFATTSYSKNGLAVQEGVASVKDLVGIVGMVAQNALGLTAIPPFPVFLIGASEGGLVTTLAIERYPEIFTGGTAACGPVGDFRKQINYWGDFRAVFDVYFPISQLGKNPVSIPGSAMADWTSSSSVIKAKISTLMNADLAKGGKNISRLLTATGAPIDPLNKVATIEQTTIGLMDYNILATMEAISTLGGNPYTNKGKIYTAIPLDPRLNLKVVRVNASPVALKQVDKYYQTSGKITRPLVLLHTTGDPIVPYWHTLLYQKKVMAQNKLSNLAVIPILRYGHCQFKPEEAVFAFEIMLLKAAFQSLTADEIQAALPDARSREGLMQLKETYQKQNALDPVK